MEENSTFEDRNSQKFEPIEKCKNVMSIKFQINENGTFNDIKKAMIYFFGTKKAFEINEIIIGKWTKVFDHSLTEIIDIIIKNKKNIPNIKHFFIGDIDDFKIPWLYLCDLAPLLNEFPDIESLHIKGSTCLEFKSIKHEKLKKIIIESDCLSTDIIDAVSKAKLPALEHLELYLGLDQVDGITNILPLLEKRRFPSLKYLGLVNSDIVDRIAEEIVKTDIFDQLEVLDLSKGALSDKGAEFLLGCNKINKLKFLDLHHHFMSDESIEKFKNLQININVSEQHRSDYHFIKYGE